ncbi:MAG: ABC transporter substrate-binding protein, partial [Abitibacteriaceae bacterium]|nr:ABC transporter substrate-binding protein [Abditibacteriaceae bacterium]
MKTFRAPSAPATILGFAACGVALSFSLTGCGNNSESSAPSSSTSASTASSDNSTTASTTSSSGAATGGPITIGYSDWPGWTVWEIADKQGFFKKEGVDVKLKWFENYTDSINALSAGQVDGNSQTWSDTMPALAKGQSLKVVLVNDNSFGNDAMIAQPGINSVKD